MKQMRNSPFITDLHNIWESIPNVGDGKVGMVEYDTKVIKLVCLRPCENEIVIGISIIEDGKEILVKEAPMIFNVLGEIIGGERHDGEKHIVMTLETSH